jgi:cysteine synthase
VLAAEHKAASELRKRYSAAMDPTVIAAGVGVGGTVAVGIAGYWANVWSTNKTIANDRESKVWE